MLRGKGNIEMDGTPTVVTQTQRPKRERGTGRIWKIGRIFWVQFYDATGKQRRESSHSKTYKVAQKLLQRRLGEKEVGILPATRLQRIGYKELRDALVTDYEANGRKWLRTGKDGKPYICGIPPLDTFFAGYRALEITTDRLREFTAKRQEEGVANGTINRSLALLRRMLRLAVQDQKLREIPYFPMLKEAAPRKGFLEHADFQKLRAELPEHLRPVLTMGYFTGMRLGEILGLRWSNVSFLDSQVRLDTSKNDDPRTIPLTGELLEMLKIERQKNPQAEFVFVHNGERVQSFRKAWDSACERAGVPDLLFHDLRRTGVRNLVRAGVPERVAMAISGHRTRQTFERYNITSGRDLREAVRKLETYLQGRSKTASETCPETHPVSLQREKKEEDVMPECIQ